MGLDMNLVDRVLASYEASEALMRLSPAGEERLTPPYYEETAV